MSVLKDITVVLSNFKGLKSFLEGEITATELNERVFCNGFMPVRYQEQTHEKYGNIFVIQGIADKEFLKIESERMKDGTYYKGWTLFLEGPCKYAKLKLLNGSIIDMRD